ncbi:hypothetical protein O181_084616 [Austropuccinia psidii MF-1]|uniref:Uncharacterized protein n=1 Tax=Austropuccinia psidii MF-1 TaxID=1389203 RepID=A0A9Q3IIZ1_9BASI|nr:hypothetical protein [Austropuccinia psidii MF-1]
MLTRPPPLQMRLQHCPPSPPSPLLIRPHPRRLPSSCSCSALKMRLKCLPDHSSCFHIPASSSPWLTILMLLRGPQIMPLTAPSPPLTPPCTHCLPSLRLWSASTTCLRCRLPSLCLWSAFLKCLRHHLPSLRSWSAFPTCLRHGLPSLRLYSVLPTCLQHHLPLLCWYSALPTFLQRCLPSLCLCSALPTCL